MRYLPAHVVNLTLLGEPIGATVLAAALPRIREVPSSATFLGGALVLAGVYVTARSATAPPTRIAAVPSRATTSPGMPD